MMYKPGPEENEDEQSSFIINKDDFVQKCHLDKLEIPVNSSGNETFELIPKILSLKINKPRDVRHRRDTGKFISLILSKAVCWLRLIKQAC